MNSSFLKLFITVVFLLKFLQAIPTNDIPSRSTKGNESPPMKRFKTEPQSRSQSALEENLAPSPYYPPEYKSELHWTESILPDELLDSRYYVNQPGFKVEAQDDDLKPDIKPFIGQGMQRNSNLPTHSAHVKSETNDQDFKPDFKPVLGNNPSVESKVPIKVEKTVPIVPSTSSAMARQVQAFQPIHVTGSGLEVPDFNDFNLLNHPIAFCPLNGVDWAKHPTGGPCRLPNGQIVPATRTRGATTHFLGGVSVNNQVFYIPIQNPSLNILFTNFRNVNYLLMKNGSGLFEMVLIMNHVNKIILYQLDGDIRQPRVTGWVIEGIEGAKYLIGGPQGNIIFAAIQNPDNGTYRFKQLVILNPGEAMWQDSPAN